VYRLHLNNVEPGMWRATSSDDPTLSGDGFGTGWSVASGAL